MFSLGLASFFSVGAWLNSSAGSTLSHLLYFPVTHVGTSGPHVTAMGPGTPDREAQGRASFAQELASSGWACGGGTTPGGLTAQAKGMPLTLCPPRSVPTPSPRPALGRP